MAHVLTRRCTCQALKTPFQVRTCAPQVFSRSAVTAAPSPAAPSPTAPRPAPVNGTSRPPAAAAAPARPPAAAAAPARPPAAAAAPARPPAAAAAPARPPAAAAAPARPPAAAAAAPARPAFVPRTFTAPENGAPSAGEAYKGGLGDDVDVAPQEGSVDWAHSFQGLSQEPFSKEVTAVLTQALDPKEIEIKPDGILYLPEIKYRRILSRAFGSGGWGLAPRGAHIITDRHVTREYALVCHGRLVSVARGEQQYFDPAGIPTATEGCKSNALMRCCKDLGIASELWDPRFIKMFKKQNCVEIMTEHVLNKKRKKLWFRRGDEVEYPFRAV